MDFEFEAGIDAHDQIVEACVARGRSDFEGDAVEMFHAVKSGVGGRHVDVARGANEAILHFQHSFRSHDVAAGRAFDVAGHFYGQIDAELDGVGDREFDLRQIPAWAEDAEIWDHAAARSDERHGLLGGKLAFLIEPLVDGEFCARPEEHFQILRRNVHVPRGAIHDERRGGLRPDVLSDLPGQRRTNERFDEGAAGGLGGTHFGAQKVI